MYFHSVFLSFRVVEALLWDLDLAPILLLYLGPETIMPLASVLAAFIGVVLIFWRFMVGLIRKIFRLVRGLVSDKFIADEAYVARRGNPESDDQGW
jgi:hypothetical protein